MRGAFVVRVLTARARGPLEGLVEEVDTGTQARFRSGNELIRFLRNRVIQMQREMQQGSQTREGSNERHRENQ